MSLKNRYLFLKKIYPDYLIIFEHKNKYISYGIDNELLQHIKIINLNKFCINFIVLKNLSVNKIKKFKTNLYSDYYLKYSLIKLINLISRRKTRKNLHRLNP